jgi:hypothetical protein
MVQHAARHLKIWVVLLVLIGGVLRFYHLDQKIYWFNEAFTAHLQALFGILGKRWRENDEYRTRYINEHRIDLPVRYRIPETDVADGGAYW